VEIHKGTLVSILRPTRLFAERVNVVLHINFQMSQAYEAHERAVWWETSPRAWLENVRSIEMYHGLRPVPESFCEPDNGMHSAQLNELLKLRFEKKKSFLTFIVAAPA